MAAGDLQSIGRPVDRATDLYGEKIWISALTEVSASHSRDRMHWKGIAELFLKGDLDEFDASGGEVICSAFIPPTPMALANVSYLPSHDGTITMQVRDGAREGIHWNTKLGTAELIDNYRYADNKSAKPIDLSVV